MTRKEPEMNEKNIKPEEQESKAKIVRRIIKGVVSFLLQREKIIIEKEEIQSILPHRGRALMLDRVVITGSKLQGELTVREEHCSGHEIGGRPILPGVDFPEMAAQLLGIWVAQYAINSEAELDGKIAPLRQASFKTFRPVRPGDLVVIETPIIEMIEKEREAGESGGDESPRIEMVGRPGRLIQKAVGENFVATVKDKLVAKVFSVELSIIDIQSLAE